MLRKKGQTIPMCMILFYQAVKVQSLLTQAEAVSDYGCFP